MSTIPYRSTKSSFQQRINTNEPELTGKGISMTKNIALKDVAQYIPKKPVKNLYSWADALFRGGNIKGAILHSLKAIVSCGSLSHPTIEQINKARTRSASLKFAQSSPISNRTLRRHIQQLEEMGYIQVLRTRDARRNSRNAYTVMAPEEVVSCRSEDIMSSSITLATSYINNNTKTDLPERKPAKQLGIVFDKEQLAILAVLTKWQTWKPIRERWVRDYTTQELQDGVNYVMSKNIDEDERGGYMRRVIEGIDLRKREKKLSPNLQVHGLMETDMLLREQDEMVRNKSSLGAGRAWLAKIKGK